MKTNDILGYGLIFMTVITIFVLLAVGADHDARIQQQQKRQEFIKDSLEIEYYKKVLDQTYAFDHSKIPGDASDTTVRAAR
jgi:cell division protein FtsL